MSVLLPETLRILREAGRTARAELFTPGAAVAFEEAYTRAPFKVLPRTDGWYIAFETGRPNGQGVRGAYTSPSAALLDIEAILANGAPQERPEASE